MLRDILSDFELALRKPSVNITLLINQTEKKINSLIPRDRMIESAKHLEDNLKLALKIRNAEIRGWNRAINKTIENMNGKESICEIAPYPECNGANGCDTCEHQPED